MLNIEFNIHFYLLIDTVKQVTDNLTLVEEQPLASNSEQLPTKNVDKDSSLFSPTYQLFSTQTTGMTVLGEESYISEASSNILLSDKIGMY